MSEDEEGDDCPLCVEPMEDTDKAYRPCKCGFGVRRCFLPLPLLPCMLYLLYPSRPPRYACFAGIKSTTRATACVPPAASPMTPPTSKCLLLSLKS